MEKLNPTLIEEKEQIDIKTETITADDFLNLVYKGESLPQDKRFLKKKNGGVFKYLDLDGINEDKERKFFSLVKILDKIIGLSELQVNPYREKTIWLKFLSVDPEYQNMGYSSKLANEVFSFAKKEGYTLETSSYSKEGYKKLKNVLNRLAEEHEVNFIGKGRI